MSEWKAQHVFECEERGLLYKVTATYESMDKVAADDCFVLLDSIQYATPEGLLKEVNMHQLRIDCAGMATRYHEQFIEFMDADYSRWELLRDKAERNKVEE
jgi:hypothetical protein